MKILWQLFLLAVLVTGGYFTYQFFYPGEENRIRERLGDLAATVSIEAGAGNIRKGLMLEQFPRFFTKDCEISVTAKGSKRTMSGRSDMSQAGKYLLGMQGGIDVKFHDVTVTLNEEKDGAKVRLTSTMMMTATETLSAQEFEVEMVKEEGKWLVHRAKSHESLSR